MGEFEFPDDGNVYMTTVIGRCFDLINNGIWTGIENHQLKSWVANFDNGIERYFAACVLDNFIYRSDPQTESLIFQIFTRNIPDIFRTKIHFPHDGTCYSRLTNKHIDPLVRLVLVVKKSDRHTKSAYIIGRRLRRNSNIVDKWIIKPEEITSAYEEGVRHFIFIDDFVGSGDQFKEMYEEMDIHRFESDCFFIYTPLIAHEEGIENINNKHPNVCLSSAEVLPSEIGLFHKESKCFKDGINTPSAAKKFYYDLIDKYKLSKNNRRGYGNMDLTIAFEHAAPDNSLSIIWDDNNDKWNPLVNR